MINNQLKEKINTIKKTLLHDESSILFAQMNESLENECNDFEIIHEHKQILKLFNGGRFGCVDIFKYDTVKKNNTEEHWGQINDYYGALSGNVNLYVIGQILYEPIFIDRETKEIHITIYEEDGIVKKIVNTQCDVINFIETFIFSIKYLEIIDDDKDDRWYQFISILYN